MLGKLSRKMNSKISLSTSSCHDQFLEKACYGSEGSSKSELLQGITKRFLSQVP